MGCSREWARRIAQQIYSRYPNVLVVQSRAYQLDRKVTTDLGEVTVPAIAPGDYPLVIPTMRKWLAQNYDPDAPKHSLVLMYHPSGGFSYVRQ